MILSRGRKYLFIHIPKTGGTSMALALEARAMKDDIMLGDTPKAVNRRGRIKDVQTAGRLWKHSKLSDLMGLVSPDEVSDFFTFTLVRNPWARLVSYYHWLQLQSFDHVAVGLAKRHSFDGFLNTPAIAKSIQMNDAKSYVSLPKVNVSPCFIRLEHFKADVSPLEAHLGFSLELPHENQSKSVANYRDFYNPQTESLVSEIAASDIAEFGYSF
jgi:hypothetical protein